MAAQSVQAQPPCRKSRIPAPILRLWRRYVEYVKNPPKVMRLLYFLYVSEISYTQFLEAHEKQTQFHWFLLAGALWSLWQTYGERGQYKTPLWLLFRWLEVLPRNANTSLSLSYVAHDHYLTKRDVAEKKEDVQAKRVHSKLARRLYPLMIEAAVFGASQAVWPILVLTASFMLWKEVEEQREQPSQKDDGNE